MLSHCRHSTSATQALYRAFILPSLQTTGSSSQRFSLRGPKQHPLTPGPPHGRRTFTSTPNRHAKTRPPETRSQKWDSEITARRIYLIDPETNTLRKNPTTSHPEPRTRSDVLRRLDLKTHRLVQVQPDSEAELSPDGRGERIPICKVVSKKEIFDAEKKRKAVLKEGKRVAANAASVKTLELNWAIDGNDLSHRLGKVEQFLGEGRKVEVVLAAKKAGRKASLGECEEVLRRIRRSVGGVEGGREIKAMEGKVGGFATLLFQGRVGVQGQAQARGEKEGEV